MSGLTNLLFRYVPDVHQHPDPYFEEFTYGDTDLEAEMLRNEVSPGDYMFFWATLGNQAYITSYFVVSQVMEGEEARASREVMENYENPHLDASYKDENDAIVFGDLKKSRNLGVPLPITRSLLGKLKIQIPWHDHRTPAQNISSAFRNVRGENCKLSKKQVEVLLKEIEELDRGGALFPLEWEEKTVENVIAKNPNLIEPGAKLMYQQLSTPNGQVDLVVEDPQGTIWVIEVKRGLAPDDTLTQLLSYIPAIKQKHPKREVKGCIVCGLSSHRLREAAKHQGIVILEYRGKFALEPALL